MIILNQPLERENCRREGARICTTTTFFTILITTTTIFLLLSKTLSSAPCITTNFFKKSEKIFKISLFGKISHTSSFVRLTHTPRRNGFSSRTKDEANRGGVGRRSIAPGGTGGKAEEEEEAKRVRPDRERRRRRKSGRSAATRNRSRVLDRER